MIDYYKQFIQQVVLYIIRRRDYSKLWLHQIRKPTSGTNKLFRDSHTYMAPGTPPGTKNLY